MKRWGVLVTGALLVGCTEASPPALSVGPVVYTEAQLLGLTDARRQALADLTALALAVSDSSAAALGAPLVAEWTEDRLLEILAAELTLERLAIDDGELLDEYRADPEWELTVRHILVFSERWRTSDHRAAAEAKAGRALALLRAGTDFPQVEAQLASEGGAEARAGLLPPGREGAWVPEFWAAALALEPGALSPVTETQYGFHVLRLEDREIVPFAEARSAVARRVAGSRTDPRGVLEAWMSSAGTTAEARRSAALAEARARGLVLPASELAELQRRWDDQVAQWAGALGFVRGAGADQVAAAALAALAASGQGADLARREVSARSELLRASVDVRFGTDGTSEP